MKRASALKFLERLKIGPKLGIGFGLLILLAIVLGLFQFMMARLVEGMFEGVRSADKVASLAAQINMELLEMRRQEKNFLLRHTNQSFQRAYGNYVLPNQQYGQRLLELIEEIRRMTPQKLKDEQHYAAFLETLKSSVLGYQSTFGALVENIRIRGDQYSGLLSELSDSLDVLDFQLAVTYELEARIVSSSLQKTFLAYLRFGLKSTGYSYQSLPGQEHVDDFQYDGQRLRVLLESAENLSEAEQEILLRLTEDSLSLFDDLLALDKEILRQEIRLSVNAHTVATLAARIVSTEEDFQRETFHKFQRVQYRSTLIVIAFFLLSIAVSIALALLLTRSIARPITALTNTASHIAGASTIEEWTEQVVLERQDEIGILAQAFNRMTDRLHSSIFDLQEREEKYRRIFEDTKDLIFITSPEGQIIDANPACAELSGYTREELCRMNALAFYQNPDDRQAFREALERDGMLKNFEVPLLRKDGRIVECIVTANLRRNAAGQLLGYQGIIHDVTAAKQAERERLRAMELLKAKEAAEESNRAKSAFLANMSHELRTPLNAIIGFSQVMARSRSLAPEQQEHVGIITRSGEHLLMLINQVLALSKIEAGRMALDESDVDLFRLLHDLEGMFTLKAGKKGLNLAFDIAEGVPQYVLLDEVKLRQVLINLLNNAITFTETGGVKLEVTKVTEVTEVENATLQFSISDSGPGIASEELSTIFDAFGQSESGRFREEGTGLGLPISRKFVRLMGGNLRVTSHVGHGSIFSFGIKSARVKQSARDKRHKADSKRILALEPGQPHYRLLIVDDVPDSRKLIVTLLRGFEFELREAANGQEALDIWKEWKPHLILMDMQMPVLNGYETTKKIRELCTVPGGQEAGSRRQEAEVKELETVSRQLPTGNSPLSPIIIAITASGFEEDRRAVLAAGCDDYIRKPFRDTEIFDMLQKHLELRYVYEEGQQRHNKEEKRDAKGAWNAQSLGALPSEWLRELERSAEEANIEELFSLIEKIRERDAALANALMCLTDDFEYDEILSLLQDVKHSST